MFTVFELESIRILAQFRKMTTNQVRLSFPAKFDNILSSILKGCKKVTVFTNFYTNKRVKLYRKKMMQGDAPNVIILQDRVSNHTH